MQMFPPKRRVCVELKVHRKIWFLFFQRAGRGKGQGEVMPTLDMALFDWTDYEDMKPVDTWPSSRKKGLHFALIVTVGLGLIMLLHSSLSSGHSGALNQITGELTRSQ